ncbi:MAG: hypothetical protein O7C59_08160, partial [Rickettsia endosymbiont of Ixodes persulcatus]|nr:hypothetical protein [Rickettsia endosymbiont of Ixodes persulcatus]
PNLVRTISRREGTMRKTYFFLEVKTGIDAWLWPGGSVTTWRKTDVRLYKALFFLPTTESCKNYFAPRRNNAQNLLFS